MQININCFTSSTITVRLLSPLFCLVDVFVFTFTTTSISSTPPIRGLYSIPHALQRLLVLRTLLHASVRLATMPSFGQGGQGWRDSGRRGDDRRRGRGQQREFSNSANFSQWGEDTNRRTQLSWRRRDNDGPSQGGGQPRQQDLGNYQSNLTLNQRQQTGIPYGSQASNNLLGYKKSEDPDYADSSMDDPEVWK